MTAASKSKNIKRVYNYIIEESTHHAISESEDVKKTNSVIEEQIFQVSQPKSEACKTKSC